jgi:hypothetical protein
MSVISYHVLAYELRTESRLATQPIMICKTRLVVLMDLRSPEKRQCLYKKGHVCTALLALESAMGSLNKPLAEPRPVMHQDDEPDVTLHDKIRQAQPAMAASP